MTRGFMVYVACSVEHSVKSWDFYEKSPVVIEIVDESEKSDKFAERILPRFEKLRHGYMKQTRH
jgi:PII-like signaling protein